MGKQEGHNKPASNNRFRKQINNYNPHNQLHLNKFHQIKGHSHTHHGHELHKKKRDIERMINHLKKKNLEVEENKVEELEKIGQELESRKKNYEKEKRKQFFLSSKYKQIMNIEKRKVAKKIRDIKSQEPIDRETLALWYKKLNYIKHFPKNLKYISLFPTTELSERAAQFQSKIMDDIESDLNKRKEKLNKFEPEYHAGEQKKKPSKKDDFFLEGSGQEQQEEVVEPEQEEQQGEEQQEEEQQGQQVE